MNCPECGGKTTIIYSKNCVDGTENRRRQCKDCNHCFMTVEIRTEMLDGYLAERELNRADNKEKSLCWQCKRAYGGCSWARDFVPVKGWEAVQTVIKTDKSASNPTIDSYNVKKCPLFIQDRKK